MRRKIRDMPGKSTKKPRRAAQKSASKARVPATVPPTNGALQQYARSIFPIAGVGASAGGIEALTTLLGNLPEHPGLAIVIVQHQEAKRASGIPHVLSRTTSLPVTEAKDNEEVLVDHVYVVPPFADLTVSGGVLRFGARETRAAMPIDLFFETLAEDQGSRAIGVVLSGAASDGTRGTKAIKAEGGITFAQDETARFDSMPHAAIAAGSIDFVLSPDKIAKELVRIAHHSYVAGGADGAAGRLPAADLTRIFALLNASHDVDFTHYKPATLERRVRRRMLLNRVEDIPQYLDFIARNPGEIELLYSDLLIRVTGFFRDPEVFATLRTDVIPDLLRNRDDGVPLRVWVPGCATGEEVYSIAITFFEALPEGTSCPIQIFGTDVSDVAIDRARAGLYPESALADVSADLQGRFFTRTDEGVRVNKSVRDRCIFARQDLTKDPPFSRLDLISCRNVLIYLGAVLQRRVMSIFHYALRPDGYLLLGSSEAMSSFTDLFAVFDRKSKIYRKRPVVNHRLAVELAPLGPREPRAPAERREVDVISASTVMREADRVLLARFCPPGVVVNENLEVVQFRGRTSPYLEPAPGTASFNLLKMAREGLLSEIRTAVHGARRKDMPVRRAGVRVRTNDHTVVVDVEVIPFAGPSGDPYFAVIFEPTPLPVRVPKGKRKPAGTAEDMRELPQLKRELDATRGYLQSVIEEQEAMNEELRSANEETQSSNEELQSTNEELETAKEELQSSNEELITLNEELENRNEELALVNNDLNNILTSLEIGVLILDSGMRIRRCNLAAQRVLNLLPTDIGRPNMDMKTTLILNDLDRIISSVIDNLEVRETTVQDRNGKWFSLRIRPYKTMDNKIEGAVMVVIDVDVLRRMAPVAAAAL
ncbi:MAG TPA: CheR family methyltransferase [Thermoanaerobaculia bacterium]|nr:CheR family methyltransferase [Thermoanaerobaculia bacterium]